MIYINNIDDCVAAKILNFADDTKIYRTVITSAKEISALPPDLSNLVARSTEWQMLFNIDKCKVMHMGYNNIQAE